MNLQITDKIKLRPFADEDAAELTTIVKVNYEHLLPFLHWVKSDYSLADAKEFIDRNQKTAAEENVQTLGIFDDENLVGAIGFVVLNRPSKRCEIGYWIAKTAEGRGIITKSCEKLIDYAFDEWQMNRVEIHCATENKRSRAVPERLGFTLEGILRQSEWRHTRFYDMAIYGLLKKEWEKAVRIK